MLVEVKQINSKDTYQIRQMVLRPKGSIKDCHFLGDNDELTFHLGAFIEKKLVSIASFYFEKTDLLPAHENQFRLRGMATVEEYRGHGFSSKLLQTAFKNIKQNSCTVLWCNARVSARGFYEKVGFNTIGEVFEIPEIGPHIVMFKEI